MENDKQLFTKYDVSFDFWTSLCGSVPANPDLVGAWLQARKPSVRPPQGRSIDEIQEEIFSTIAVGEEELETTKSLLVFQRVDETFAQRPNGNANILAVRASTLKSHIKDCARQISSYYVGKIKGERSFAVRVINCVYPDVSQYWIPLLDDEGNYIREASGRRDKPVHTWQGNSLKTFEFVDNAHLKFRLLVLGGKVSQNDLETIFGYGGVHGYAGERSDGEGRYSFTIHKFKEQK